MRFALVVLLGGAVSAPAAACLWERDTLAVERMGLPDLLEAVMGIVPRHDPAVYEARVAALAGATDPVDVDDLAVAYDRLGRHAEAEAALREVLEDHPDRYETLANLGTVLVHGGDLTAGLPYLERAVAINPDAHFGREWVQLDLIQWVVNGAETEVGWTVGRSQEQIREGLIGIIAMGGPPHPAVYAALSENLVYSSYGVLALYAAERAAELDPSWFDTHPRPVAAWTSNAPDITDSYVRMRDEADAWMAEWHAWQRAEVAAGRDPTAESVWLAYLAEHPRPALELSMTERVLEKLHRLF